MVDRTSGVPVYRQVAADLRGRIDGGAYAPGSRLPSERELVEEFGASRVTIREAVSLLRSEGLLVAEHGRGVFVKQALRVERLARTRLSRSARERGEGAFLGDAAVGRFAPSVSVDVRFERADQETASWLEIGEGDEITVRDRVMAADGQPVQLALSRLPRELTRDTPMEAENPGAGGIYARLEEGGHRLRRFAEFVAARMPTPVERQRLQLDGGVPVLVVTRVAHAERPVEVNTMIMAADRYELGYEWPAD